MVLVVGDGWSDILQRNLNNAFAYDLVPSPGVITAALKAARRVNDFPTAVRIFEGTPDSRAAVMIMLGPPKLTRQHRHQGKGREHTPIPGISRGAEACTGRAGHPLEGRAVQ